MKQKCLQKLRKVFKSGFNAKHHHSLIDIREGTFFIGGWGGGGGGPGYFRNFCGKSRGPPTSQNGLMHDPSQIPTQKHLTLPHPTSSKTKITGSENN